MPVSARSARLYGSNGNELAFWLATGGGGYSTVHFFTPDKR